MLTALRHHHRVDHNILSYWTAEAIGDRTPHACRRYIHLHHRSTSVSQIDGYITAARTLQDKHTNFITSSKPVPAEKGQYAPTHSITTLVCHEHIPCLLSCVLSFRICVVFNHVFHIQSHEILCMHKYSQAHLLLQHNQKPI